MKSSLPEEFRLKFIEEMQKVCDKQDTGFSFCCKPDTGPFWDNNSSCYGSWAYTFEKSGSPHAAVHYNGVVDEEVPWCLMSNLLNSRHGAIQRQYGKNALIWLEFLLSETSPYRGIFPYLTTADPKEVLEQRGFIAHDLPMDKFYLFSQLAYAARCASENPRTFHHWMRLREIMPDNMACFLSFALYPTDYTDTAPLLKTMWHPAMIAHGRPMSVCPPSKARRFLTGDPLPGATANLHTASSQIWDDESDAPKSWTRSQHFTLKFAVDTITKALNA